MKIINEFKEFAVKVMNRLIREREQEKKAE